MSVAQISQVSKKWPTRCSLMVWSEYNSAAGKKIGSQTA
jgi:hypothetical protein